MCGHFGAISLDQLNNSQIEAFKAGMLVTASRGKDSWGVTHVNPFHKDKQKKALISRRVGISASVYQSQIAVNDPHLLLGHCRHATSGKVTIENSHPFVCRNLVGAHNGTLTQGEKTSVEKKIERKFDTDSEGLFAFLSEFNDQHEGLTEFYKTISYRPSNVGETQGRQIASTSWALVWYRLDTQQVFFHRNPRRSFCVTLSDDRRTLYYASEEWHLAQGLWSQGIGDHGDFVSLPPHRLFTFNIGKGAEPFDVDYIKEGGEEVKNPFPVVQPYRPPATTTSVIGVGSAAASTKTTKLGGTPTTPQRHGKGVLGLPNVNKSGQKGSSADNKDEPQNKGLIKVTGFEGQHRCFSCQQEFLDQERIHYFNHSYLMCNSCYSFLSTTSFHSFTFPAKHYIEEKVHVTVH